MAKVDLILAMPMMANDGSFVEAGAIMKFNSELKASSTVVAIEPRMFRSRESLESGYGPVEMPESVIPHNMEIVFTEAEFYEMTPLVLYQKVGDKLNEMIGDNYFTLNVE